MTRRVAPFLVLLCLTACSKDETGEPPRMPSEPPFEVGEPIDVDGDGMPDGVAVDADGDGTLEGVDLDGDGEADVLLPGEDPPGGDGDGDTSGDGDGDGDGSGDGDGDGDGDTAGDGDGDGDGDDEPPLPDVVVPPIAKVACGGSECAITEGKVCCASWTRAGFGTESECIDEGECVISRLGDPGKYWQFEDGLVSGVDPQRAVVSRCDGAEDCGSSQVCCFVMLGAPLSESLGPPWVGPGASRQCMDLNSCMAEGSANGVPTGVAACNDDGDCAQIEGTTCQSEQDNSATTGKNVAARPDVKVCR